MRKMIVAVFACMALGMVPGGAEAGEYALLIRASGGEYYENSYQDAKVCVQAQQSYLAQEGMRALEKKPHNLIFPCAELGKGEGSFLFVLQTLGGAFIAPRPFRNAEICLKMRERVEGVEGKRKVYPCMRPSELARIFRK